jgi:translation initiation factor 4A
MLQKIDLNEKKIQGIILTPTRELTQHIFKRILALGEYLNIKAYPSYGGTKVEKDVLSLKESFHIVIGTPGRVHYLINEGYMDVSVLKMISIDEADEMMSRGFKDQVNEIFQFLPEEIQVCLFSETMPPDVLELSQNLMNCPIQILSKKEPLPLEGMT